MPETGRVGWPGVLAAAASRGRPLLAESISWPEADGSQDVIDDLGAVCGDAVVLDVSAGRGDLPRLCDAVRAIGRPVAVRAAVGDARIAVEMAVAAGTGCYQFSVFDFLATADVSGRLWRVQEADRLAQMTAAGSGPVVRWCSPSSGAGACPVALSAACTLLDALLAREQGVTDLIISHAVTGSLAQDVATLHALRQLTRQWLGPGEPIRVWLAATQWHRRLPPDRGEAFGLAMAGTTIACVGAVDIIETLPVSGGPGSGYAETAGPNVRATQQMINLLAGQSLAVDAALLTVAETVRASATAIIEHAHVLGEGNLARGVARLVGQGLLEDLRGDTAVRSSDGVLLFPHEPSAPLPAAVLPGLTAG